MSLRRSDDSAIGVITRSSSDNGVDTLDGFSNGGGGNALIGGRKLILAVVIIDAAR